MTDRPFEKQSFFTFYYFWLTYCLSAAASAIMRSYVRPCFRRLPHVRRRQKLASVLLLQRGDFLPLIRQVMSNHRVHTWPKLQLQICFTTFHLFNMRTILWVIPNCIKLHVNSRHFLSIDRLRECLMRISLGDWEGKKCVGSPHWWSYYCSLYIQMTSFDTTRRNTYTLKKHTLLINLRKNSNNWIKHFFFIF